MDFIDEEKNFIEVEKIDSWEHLKQTIELYAAHPLKDYWIFRGHSDSTWKLRTGIERLNLAIEEPKIIDDFKRHAHLYTDTNKIDNTLEWLSVMQHNGTPTRLLDWTFSPYVAIFFALNDTTISIHDKEQRYSAVYALNYKPINLKLGDSYKNHKVYEFLSSDNFIFHNTMNDDAHFKSVFFSEFMKEIEEFPPTVLPLIPFNSHVRLTIQQGLFLCPTQIIYTPTFEENLEQTFKNISGDYIKKYLIPVELKPKIITELNYMNINDATLFPGLDGFSRFLGKETKIFIEYIRREHNVK